MQWGMLIPIVAIASGPIGWIVTTWIRARHGYPIDNEKGELIGRDGHLGDNARMRALVDENERQREQIHNLHQRLAVLERIATDPATRTAAEIDALR